MACGSANEPVDHVSTRVVVGLIVYSPPFKKLNRPMRILVFIFTILIQLTAAVVGLVLLLVGMNGYSERQATPSLVFYVVLSLATALMLAGGSPFAAKRLATRLSIGKFGASAIVVTSSSILGGSIIVVLFFASFLLAEVLRRMR